MCRPIAATPKWLHHFHGLNFSLIHSRCRCQCQSNESLTDLKTMTMHTTGKSTRLVSISIHWPAKYRNLTVDSPGIFCRCTLYALSTLDAMMEFSPGPHHHRKLASRVTSNTLQISTQQISQIFIWIYLLQHIYGIFLVGFSLTADGNYIASAATIVHSLMRGGGDSK